MLLYMVTRVIEDAPCLIPSNVKMKMMKDIPAFLLHEELQKSKDNPYIFLKNEANQPTKEKEVLYAIYSVAISAVDCKNSSGSMTSLNYCNFSISVIKFEVGLLACSTMFIQYLVSIYSY